MPIPIRSFIDALLDFVYPPLCAVCARLLDNGRVYVCPECWESIEKIHAHLPLYLETRNKLVVTEVVDELVSLFVFEKEGAFQKIVHSLKYSGVQALGVEIGRQLGSRQYRGKVPRNDVASLCRISLELHGHIFAGFSFGNRVSRIK